MIESPGVFFVGSVPAMIRMAAPTAGGFELGGADREVDILRIGRVALVYQSTDGAETGAWNKDAQSWEELSAGDYATAVRKGVRIAKKQATIELLNMPVSAPEAN